jgi:hypothetical protein
LRFCAIASSNSKRLQVYFSSADQPKLADWGIDADFPIHGVFLFGCN